LVTREPKIFSAALDAGLAATATNVTATQSEENNFINTSPNRIREKSLVHALFKTSHKAQMIAQANSARFDPAASSWTDDLSTAHRAAAAA